MCGHCTISDLVNRLTIVIGLLILILFKTNCVMAPHLRRTDKARHIANNSGCPVSSYSGGAPERTRQAVSDNIFCGDLGRWDLVLKLDEKNSPRVW
jgi:hypothetical protein